MAHQIYVWLSWRAQLGWGVLSRWFGDWDLTIYGLFFIPLVLARPIVVLILGIADFGSLSWGFWGPILIGFLLLLPSLYTIWSVFRYFGFQRALGGDHFRKRFQEMPLVDEGVFRWCSNAMYALGLLLLWSIGFFTRSTAAIGLAFFQHAYVWVHYFCTEKPDMKKIYNSGC